MTVLLSALILAAALACAYLAQATARHGAHGVAYALSDWFLALGLGVQYGLQCWRQFRSRAMERAPAGGTARKIPSFRRGLLATKHSRRVAA